MKRTTWMQIFLSILISMCLVGGNISIPTYASGNGIQQKIDSILQKYPTGSYFSRNGGKCNHGYNEVCDNCNITNIDYQAYQCIGNICWTCKAFANSCFYRIFGIKMREPGNAITDVVGTNSLITTAKIGDFIACFDSAGNEVHAGIYLRGGNGSFYLYESNVPNVPNRVSYGEYAHNGSSEGWVKYRVFHAKNYEQINGTSSGYNVSYETHGTGGSRGSVTETNATLYSVVHTSARSGIKIGLRIGKSSGNWNVKSHEEDLSSAGYSQLNSNGYFETWFECNNELGVSLSSGTTYYYQFYIKINGNEYADSVRSFKTGGPSAHNPIGSLDGVTNTYYNEVNVRGWAYDEDQPSTALDIHVYMGGPAGKGTCVATGKANKLRTDVNDCYPGAGNYHGYDFSFKTSLRGKQDIYVYALNVGGGNHNPCIGSKTITIEGDKEKPVVVSASITSFDRDGYTVTATAKDNIGVTKIKFPSWSSSCSEADIKWYTGTSVVNGTSTCRINVKDMKAGDGRFWTDVRAYDAEGNMSDYYRLKITIDRENPVISDVKVDKLSEVSYKVSCKVQDANLSGVKFGTSVNGKNKVWKNVAASNGMYEAVINASDFAYESGTYVTVINAKDTFGNQSEISAERIKLDVPQKPLTQISLDRTDLRLPLNGTETLSVTYTPQDTTENRDVVWSTSNENIVQVKNGVLTGKGCGSATITAKVGKLTATCNVVVCKMAKTPVANVSSGTVNRNTMVSLHTDTTGAKIFYTLDGTVPSTKSKLYTSPIPVNRDMTLKAVAVKAGYDTSDIASYTYTLNKKDFEQYGDIEPQDIPDGEIPSGLWVAGIASSYDYTGAAIKPAFRVYDYNVKLVEQKDYTVSYGNNIKAGTGVVNIKGKGNYSKNIIRNFVINPKNLQDADITAQDISVVENGKVQKKAPVVKWGKKTLAAKTDYTINYKDGGFKEPGRYTIELTGKGNYTGTITLVETITDRKTEVLMSKATVSQIKDQVYTGAELTPMIVVKMGKKTLQQNQDYELEYRNNVGVGTATVSIKGLGIYKGVKQVSFNITGISMSKVRVEGIQDLTVEPGKKEYIQTGLRLYCKQNLLSTKACNITYKNNKKAGTATIIFKGNPEYGFTGTLSKTFRILSNKNLAEAQITYPTRVEYCKGGAKPAVTVTLGGIKLIPNVDYSVTYSNYMKLSNGKSKLPTITITGKGDYKGTITKNYVIVVKKTQNLTVKVDDLVYSSKKANYINKFAVMDTDGMTLKAGVDYKKNWIYYVDGKQVVKNANLPVGTLVVAKTQGTGAYEGDIETSFRITSNSFGNVTVKIADQQYTGKEIKLNKRDIRVAVRTGKKTVLLNSDQYEIVGYKNNIKAGTATVILKGTGDYAGIKKVNFKIKAKPLMTE